VSGVAYQGLAGAFSEAAAAALFPDGRLEPRPTFADVFAALESSAVGAVVVPVENTHAGSVADVYDLLRQHQDARIVAEAVVRVRHCLLAVRGTRIGDVRVARSHPQALAQVEEFLRRSNIRPEVAFDTAGAAAEVAERNLIASLSGNAAALRSSSSWQGMAGTSRASEDAGSVGMAGFRSCSMSRAPSVELMPRESPKMRVRLPLEFFTGAPRVRPRSEAPAAPGASGICLIRCRGN